MSGDATGPETEPRREGWRLADTRTPFDAGALPAGLEATGRLVTVRVVSPSRARFGEHAASPGARLAVLAYTRISGDAVLEGGQLRVTVWASEASVLLVGALAAVFVLGGSQFFLSGPSIGRALAGAVPAAFGAWIALQIRRAGREVAADVARVLGVLTRERGGAPARPS